MMEMLGFAALVATAGADIHGPLAIPPPSRRGVLDQVLEDLEQLSNADHTV